MLVMTIASSKILAGILGVCVADALGVPVEFTSRAERQQHPVDGMWGYGTWNQPPGTWSDDSSLMLCLVDALCEGFSLDTIARNFCRWYADAFWTPHGTVFDIGNATQAAIAKLQQGVTPLQAGGTHETSNGNGSLMRILPMAFLPDDLPTLIERTHQVSCITHAHPRSQMACGIYISIARCLLHGMDLSAAYQEGIRQIVPFYEQEPFAAEKPTFERVLSGTIAGATIDSIRSGGYVVDTLEAALWCLLNTRSYPEAVLSAVNLGDDTDTTAAVTGGLAGIHYGVDAIPAGWINAIARKDDIVDLVEWFAAAI